MNVQFWNPLEQIPPRLYLEGLYDDYEGFRLLLKGETISSQMLRIMFVSILSYRNTNESNRLNTLNNMPELSEEWSLFRTKESEYANWLFVESLGTIPLENINHFIVSTPNDIVEILSFEEPIVEWL